MPGGKKLPRKVASLKRKKLNIMKKQKIVLGKKLFLNKGTIAALTDNHAGRVVGGILPTDMTCHKTVSVRVCPATVGAAQTLCCPSWPPQCSAVIACLG